MRPTVAEQRVACMRLSHLLKIELSYAGHELLENDSFWLSYVWPDVLPCQSRHLAEAQAVADSQAQHLDDLEDILNSPAPALDHPASTEDSCVACQDTRAQDSTTEPPSNSTPAAAQQIQPSALLSSSAQSHDAPHGASNMQADANGNASKKPRHGGQLSVWNTAYQSASAPIAAVWARLPEHLQRLSPQTVSQAKRLLKANDVVRCNANLLLLLAHCRM